MLYCKDHESNGVRCNQTYDTTDYHYCLGRSLSLALLVDHCLCPCVGMLSLCRWPILLSFILVSTLYLIYLPGAMHIVLTIYYVCVCTYHVFIWSIHYSLSTWFSHTSPLYHPWSSLLLSLVLSLCCVLALRQIEISTYICLGRITQEARKMVGSL